MAFITFLALKNTPLAFLSAYSYERLNIFHQVAGYITVIYALLHTLLETLYFYKEDYTSVLVEMAQINGMIATGGMFVIMVTAIILKKLHYEVFYITHIMMYMLILINMGLHRPDFATKTVIITIFAASMWAYDRIFRMLKLLFHFYGNRATLTPLADGTTRVVLSRAPWQAAAGNHCFLWIPSIRLVETHPFTIASVGPHSMEIVVAGHDGFTKELYNFARKHPGASLRASIDGPYGTVPNFAKEADKVVFIAGGSGASFTFGAALHMIHQLGNSAATSIEFIWAVKHQGTYPFHSVGEVYANDTHRAPLLVHQRTLGAPILRTREHLPLHHARFHRLQVQLLRSVPQPPKVALRFIVRLLPNRI